MRPTLLHRIRNRIDILLLGDKVLNSEDRIPFRRSILTVSCSHTRIMLIFVCIIQFFNILLNTPALISDRNAHYLKLGHVWFITLSIVFFYLFSRYKMKILTNHRLGNRLLKGCWILIMVGSLFFTYCDYVELHTVNTYTLIVLAVGILPIFSASEIFLYLTVYSIINLLMSSNTNIPIYLYQHMGVMVILSSVNSQLQFASYMNLFLERKRLNSDYRKLEYLADTDQLTELLNRRGLEKYIRHLIDNMSISGMSISLLMMDIDFFKSYNDTYLHISGDKCLKMIADCLKKSVHRKTDIISRFGGEEFVIIVNDTKEQDLIKIALRIKNAIENLHIEAKYNKDFPYVTMSIGITTSELMPNLVDKKTFIDDLINEADKELYNAKTNGKNCVSMNRVIYR